MAEYTIEKKDNKIYVSVEVKGIPKDSKGPFNYEKVGANQAKNYLKKNNIEFGRLLKNDTARNENGDDSGLWIFEKKSVDKPKKQVTLKEEKPKTTRRRRTKKASTED